MSCNCQHQCHCQFNNCNHAVQIIGLCNPDTIVFENETDNNNFTEISIPEVLTVPYQKPDIETIDKVFVQVKILSKRVIETPSSGGLENEEGTILTGYKLIVEGVLKQKVVYTALNEVQSVHSAHFNVPFSTFIVLPATATLEDHYCIESCVEDVFVKALNPREIFKNVTLFLRAKLLPENPCA
ncbi:DUF3794 domain-containing protein [Bacillus sp. NTK074B]|uniref:DUF3794 domain-containing protein n=1 Tax=Bacillus sp. NTK074B TaxID=2802174 RepID=UPI001A8C55D9|nr:DUF3794 domain-containing protein [Bacillus sp. NTK074B]